MSEAYSQDNISSGCPGMLWELDDAVIILDFPSLTKGVLLVLLSSSF